MIFCGKQLPSRATTQSKLTGFCMYVLSKNSMKFTSSLALTFSKQDTVTASKHLIALEPNHRLHVDAISKYKNI